MAKSPEERNPSAIVEANDSELATEIARRIESIVPRNQQAQVVAQVVSIFQQERFSGPIAHPRHLREYEEILPGSAERIVQMAEESLKHRHELQNRVMQADMDDTRAGRNYGFISLVVLAIGAAFCIWMGNTTGAGLFLGAGTLGAIGKFIDGRSKPKD